MANPITQPAALPEGFTYLEDVESSIQQDVRYATHHNFVGNPLPGYHAPVIIMTYQAAEALIKVQQELIPFGLGLKVYDAYRPQKCVDEFVRWSRDLDDVRMKPEFYPHLTKKDLFSGGYIGSPSTHTRGSTVDLTIVPLHSPLQELWKPGDPVVGGARPQHERSADNSIDMGTSFDYLGEQGHAFYPNLSSEVKANRALLRTLMEKHGFRGIRVEWWHFTLENEPFPDTYFDFDIE